MEIIGQEGTGNVQFKSSAGIFTRDLVHIRTIIDFRGPRDVCLTKDKRYLISRDDK